MGKSSKIPSQLANFDKRSTYRNPTFDLLKTWAIFLVILQHCIASLGWGMEMMNTPAGKAITMMNMPLFIFITGYFSKSSMSRPFKTILSQKWVTMLRPMFIFTVGLTILKLIWHPSYLDGVVHFAKFFIQSTLTTYWFIWIAVLCVLYARMVYAISNEHTRWAVHLVLLIVLMLIPRSYYIPFVVNLQAMYPFFLVGLIMSEKGLIRFFERYRWQIFAISAAVFAWQYIGFTGPKSFYYFTSMPVKEWLANFGIMLLCGFSGIALSYILFSSVPNTRFVGRLVYYGQYTFLIYMLQQYFVFFFEKGEFNILDFCAELAISVIEYCLIIAMTFAIRKNKYMSLYLMGKCQ